MAKEFELDISPKKVQIANKRMKRCSSLDLRNLNQNHNDLALTHARMDITKKEDNNESWQRCVEMGTVIHC